MKYPVLLFKERRKHYKLQEIKDYEAEIEKIITNLLEQILGDFTKAKEEFGEINESNVQGMREFVSKKLRD